MFIRNSCNETLCHNAEGSTKYNPIWAELPVDLTYADSPNVLSTRLLPSQSTQLWPASTLNTLHSPYETYLNFKKRKSTQLCSQLYITIQICVPASVFLQQIILHKHEQLWQYPLYTQV